MKENTVRKTFLWGVVVLGVIALWAVIIASLLSKKTDDAPVVVNLPTLTPVATLAATEPPTEAPQSEPTPLPDRFGVFTDGEVVATENEYRTKDVAVFFSMVQEDRNQITGRRLTYYIADVYVRQTEDLRCGLANGNLHDRISMREISQSHNAIVALSGDFAAWRRTGLCVRNGEVFREVSDRKRDVGVLLSDGRLITYEVGAYDAQDLLALNPWHAWSFGPALLTEDGQSKERFNSNVNSTSARAVFGYYEPGHYCLIIVCRDIFRSEGMHLKELSRFVRQLGCKAAYNMDGGRTAHLYWNGEVYASSNGSRPVNDIIYIGGQM